MKKLATFTACVGLCLMANAIPVEIPGLGPGLDSPKSGNNDPTGGDFAALQAVISAYNAANPGATLPTPVSGNNQGTGGKNNTGLSGFDYAVLHYGTGPGGQNSGGGLEVWFLNGASSFDFPANGTGDNGFGGFSSINLYTGTGGDITTFPPQGTVPDGGSTVALLGFALAGAEAFRRKIQK